VGTYLLRKSLGALLLGITVLLLSCGQRLPTPYPSPTPRVAPPPSPESTRCLQPREWRPSAGKNSGDTRDLTGLQQAVPFPLQAPTYLPDGFTLDRATYNEYVDGTWDVAIYYARLPNDTQAGGLITVYYNQSAETILEYLAARLVNACALQQVQVSGHAGYTLWDAGTGGEPAVLIWQDGDLKVSIWVELGDVRPSADKPHILDDLLLQLAESMRPIGAQGHDIVPTELDALGRS
jgi:hypothetical protein